MLKSYEELRKIDVKPYCEDRDGFIYLNWAKCIDLLHQNGAEKVYWIPLPSENTGNSLRVTEQVFADSKGNTNRCYETRIKVVIDHEEYEIQTPVMNGTSPVKDNSMNQQRVWNSMCRAFVKCVAINTGLGFDLWLKEEMQPFNNVLPVEDEPPTAAEIKVLKDLCAKHKINLDYWCKSNGKKIEEITANDVGRMLRAINERYGDE